MQFEELRYVCLEAAVDLVRSQGRPVAPTVVLPGRDRTRLLTLPGFPEHDADRHAYLAEVARDEISGARVPCWGFVAEAELAGDDAVVVAFGARRHAPHVTASRYAGGELEEFVPSEELDPAALPFLHPLQRAVDELPPLDSNGNGGLPLLPT